MLIIKKWQKKKLREVNIHKLTWIGVMKQKPNMIG